MSRTFSTNKGSLESFQCSTRCGCSPNARQIRETVDCDSPVRLAICRVDQCVPPSGGADSSARTTTSSTWSSLTVRGRPGRGSSTNPSNRSAANRARHFVTVGRLTPNRCAISTLLSPRAQANTIRARCANPAAVCRRRAQRSSCSRSLSLSSISTAFGPRLAMPEDYHKSQMN